MKRTPLSPASLSARTVVYCSLLLLLTSSHSVVAQTSNDYTKKIREYTTERYFMTELVDHLPLSDKVPSPEKVLGYVVGTPNKLTYTKDLYRYYRELDKASPRVRVFIAPEKSEEGKRAVFDRSSATKPISRNSIVTKRSPRSSPIRARSTTPKRTR